jgi:xylose isomerase
LNTSFHNKYDKTNILLRRDEVRRLSTQGLTETEIGQRLGISQSCVSLDLQYMECMAAERMKEHIEKTIPSVHAMCEDGLRQVLKIAWNSINNKIDMKPSELTQKLALIAELYEKIYNLSTERPTLKIAMEIVEREKERLRILKERYGSTNNNTDNLVDTQVQEIREIQESIAKLEPDIEEDTDTQDKEDTDTDAIEEEEEQEIEIKEN